jgi:hypothetical protein
MIRSISLIGLLLFVSSPAFAHKVVEPGEPFEVANGVFTATSGKQWNRLEQKEGEFQEVWSIDGHQLNRIAFYGAIPVDEPLIRELDKKRAPLPKVQQSMLLPDIPVLLERTYRTQYGIPVFQVGVQEPASFMGRSGIRFEYAYTRPDDEVNRTGEAFATLVDGKLYLVTYEAPALHYFERDRSEFRGIIERLMLKGETSGTVIVR